MNSFSAHSTIPIYTEIHLMSFLRRNFHIWWNFRGNSKLTYWNSGYATMGATVTLIYTHSRQLWSSSYHWVAIISCTANLFQAKFSLMHEWSAKGSEQNLFYGAAGAPWVEVFYLNKKLTDGMNCTRASIAIRSLCLWIVYIIAQWH